jgi:hypothetical protein
MYIYIPTLISFVNNTSVSSELPIIKFRSEITPFFLSLLYLEMKWRD